ncbi:Amine oxidase [flavin-containing] B [Colletotrichum chlorophyti]|uniref:Amine oxidase n=1 Tax=Colletotrichum chlorophyti TaxID=708187 RepID=A0A1Q8RWT5_9PEZI|nr:Amine oxidase [flavin-containing] B [Colletotrichum chlorophyti]
MSAYNLSQAGHKTLLLEARHRIGGRSWTLPLRSNPDAIIEMGATWINETSQPFSYRITKEFDIETEEQYEEGAVIEQDEEGNIDRGSYQPEKRKRSLGSVEKFYIALGIAAETVDINNFNKFPEDKDVTMSEWAAKLKLGNETAVQAACDTLVRGIVGRDAHEVGAHYFLDYVKSGDGLASLTNDLEGAQQLKFKKGTSAITDALANAMPEGRIWLNSPVDEITQHGDGEVHVRTKSGLRCKAKKVIVAIPTNTYTKIHFTPPLPEDKRALVTRTMPGIYAKVLINYASPWWREAGLAGKFRSIIGPIGFSFDTSDLDAQQYSLAIFVTGHVAAAWHQLTDLGREEAIIEHLAELAGPELADKARDVTEINTVEWTKEDYLWGGPTCAMRPGMLRKYGEALREPFGDLHFGGGETAYEWKGYLEGALLAGVRAAEEVLESLGDPN